MYKRGIRDTKYSDIISLHFVGLSLSLAKVASAVEILPKISTAWV